MPRTWLVAVAMAFGATALAAMPGEAAAQESPMSVGPLGTPITPAQIGAWIFSPAIGKAAAGRDARTQGFDKVRDLHRDEYGNWIGDSAKGPFIVFPDGRAYPR